MLDVRQDTSRHSTRLPIRILAHIVHAVLCASVLVVALRLGADADVFNRISPIIGPALIIAMLVLLLTPSASQSDFRYITLVSWCRSYSIVYISASGLFMSLGGLLLCAGFENHSDRALGIAASLGVMACCILILWTILHFLRKRL